MIKGRAILDVHRCANATSKPFEIAAMVLG
jgi:hypothetical protein